MTKIINFSEYQSIKFRTLKYYKYLEKNNPEILQSLQFNDIDYVIALLEKNNDDLTYHACLGYACFETNLDLFNELLTLNKKIDLKIIYDSIFGSKSAYDLLEASVMSFGCENLKHFFSKITKEDLKISFSNIKQKDFGFDDKSILFEYPEILLYLQDKNLNFNNILLTTDNEQNTLIESVLLSGLSDKETYNIFNLLGKEYKNDYFIELLGNITSLEVAEHLLKQIIFYPKEILNEKIDASFLILLSHDIFKKTFDYIDYTKPELYERGIGNMIIYSKINSKLGDAYLNLNYLLEQQVKLLKDGEKLTFYKDSEDNTSLLHFLILNQRLFDKYIDQIDFNDSYVQEQILGSNYEPLIDKCKSFMHNNKTTKIKRIK